LRPIEAAGVKRNEYHQGNYIYTLRLIFASIRLQVIGTRWQWDSGGPMASVTAIMNEISGDCGEGITTPLRD
jgi:hypothetical protein